MSGLPEELHHALTETLGTEPLRVTRLSGGMINHAARVETANGPVFAKWRENSPPDFFNSEALSLSLLREAGALRVPEALGTGLYPENRPKRQEETRFTEYLILEYIETRPPSDPARFARRFGEGLAALHRDTRPDFEGGFGLPLPGYIGALPQLNAPLADWAAFYRERRLLPQIEIARRKGHLPEERERLLMRLIDKIEILLADLPARPVLIHGDLWSGNFLSAGNEPVLIDPAAYYADREIEIAYMELFGGFPSGILAAYRAVFPLDPGYERRRALHQLYPLLVHLNHFGETYGPDVEAVCRQYI